MALRPPLCLVLLILTAGCSKPPAAFETFQTGDAEAACLERWQDREPTDGFDGFADFVEFDGATIMTALGTVPADASVTELRAAFGRPDSTARNEQVLLGPLYPDGHPLYWFYPAASFLVLPDSTVTLVRLDVASGAALRFGGVVLNEDVRLAEVARRYPLSWTCRGVQSSNWDALGDDNPTTEALTLIDSTSVPSRPFYFRQATLQFDGGRLVEVIG